MSENLIGNLCSGYDVSLGQLLLSLGEPTETDYYDKCLNIAYIGSGSTCTGRMRFVEATPSTGSTGTAVGGMCVGYCNRGDREVIAKLKNITYRTYGDFDVNLPVCVPNPEYDKRTQQYSPYIYGLMILSILLFSYLAITFIR